MGLTVSCTGVQRRQEQGWNAPRQWIPEERVMSELRQIAGEIVENQIPELHFLKSSSGWSSWTVICTTTEPPKEGPMLVTDLSSCLNHMLGGPFSVPPSNWSVSLPRSSRLLKYALRTKDAIPDMSGYGWLLGRRSWDRSGVGGVGDKLGEPEEEAHSDRNKKMQEVVQRHPKAGRSLCPPLEPDSLACPRAHTECQSKGMSSVPLTSSVIHFLLTLPSHSSSIKKSQRQRWESVKEVDPKFLRNMHFAKKHNKKGVKKMPANNAKATSARAEAVQALIKPNEVKLKIPKGGSHQFHQLAYITYPKLETPARATLPRVSGSTDQRPRARLKPKPRLQLALWLWFPKGFQQLVGTITWIEEKGLGLPSCGKSCS
ncbi:hypothetical protein GH733_016680 [Mirounga leonina]|nr:hypothetical protein GH733_016680 [Mirounga leonina]